MEENESLKPSMRRQPVSLQDHQKKKRSHPSSNQIGNSKRLKAAQLEVDPLELPPMSAPNQMPDITTTPTLLPNQVPNSSPVFRPDAGQEELLPAPEPDGGIEDGPADTLSSARRSNRVAERTRDITEQRWGNGHLRDEIPKSDRGGGGYRSEDEEDVDLNNDDSDDEDREDDDGDREDDDDDDLFTESGVTGISAWDLLGEGFEREVASTGMFLAQDSSVLLTIV